MWNNSSVQWSDIDVYRLFFCCFWFNIHDEYNLYFLDLEIPSRIFINLRVCVCVYVLMKGNVYSKNNNVYDIDLSSCFCVCVFVIDLYLYLFLPFTAKNLTRSLLSFLLLIKQHQNTVLFKLFENVNKLVLLFI